MRPQAIKGIPFSHRSPAKPSGGAARVIPALLLGDAGEPGHSGSIGLDPEPGHQTNQYGEMPDAICGRLDPDGLHRHGKWSSASAYIRENDVRSASPSALYLDWLDGHGRFHQVHNPNLPALIQQPGAVNWIGLGSQYHNLRDFNGSAHSTSLCTGHSA